MRGWSKTEMKKTAARKQRLPVERASVAGAVAKRERERRGEGGSLA